MDDDGVKLVNHYVKLYDEKKEFMDRHEAEMEMLKNAIIAYAKREEMEVLRGSDHKLRIKIEMKPKFPGKGDDDREALELLLKSAGAWPDVSTLDTFALARALKNNKMDRALLNNLAAFIKTEESCRFSLSSLKNDED